MECPFGERVDEARPDISLCPLTTVMAHDGDSETCHCLIEVLLHALGNADDQTAYICGWWADRHVFDCDPLDRARLAEFRSPDTRDGRGQTF
jgi:hypothetical protein